MTTTTDRPRASSPVASHLRRYLLALLAAAYVMAWWFLGIRAPPTPDEPRTTGPTPETSARHGLATWFHDLPAAERPVVNLPGGWHIADRTTSSQAVTPRAPVRKSPARRIRTRSS